MDTKVATHVVTVSEPWFTYLKEKRKKFEGRRYTAAIARMKVGDAIQFVLPGERETAAETNKFTRTIVKLHPFGTFREALQTLPLDSVLPNVATVDEGVAIYLKFVSEATQLKDGVRMIEVE